MTFQLLHHLRHARRGAVLVEFAVALPVLLMLVMGMLSYGHYIWIAHAAQQVANDAARAAVAGVSASDRRAIAQDVLAHTMPSLPDLRRENASIALDEHGGYVTARVRVDASGAALMQNAFVPLPDPVIVRDATTKLEPAA